MTTLRAVLWDVDGTIAETERDGHRVAFNQAFEACGVPWRWEEARYGELLHVSGGRERLLADMDTRADAPTETADREALARRLHGLKNEAYAALVREGCIALRGGVVELMQECLARGVRMGIATTTSAVNLDALLRHHLGPKWVEWFAVRVCGEDVQRKKPDPEVYEIALHRLDVAPLQTVAIEDSPWGAAAARAVDIPVLVTQSAYFASATIEEAIAIGPGLHERDGWRPAAPGAADGSRRVGLDDVQAWHAGMEVVSQFG